MDTNCSNNQVEEEKNADDIKDSSNEKQDAVDNMNQQPCEDDAVLGDDVDSTMENKQDESSSSDGGKNIQSHSTDDVDEEEDEEAENEEKFNNAPPQHLTLACTEGRVTDVLVYNAKVKETVVIFHGFGGRKEEFHEGRMCQRLANKYRVITFDWYGHGKSSKTEVYNKEAFLEQADNVVCNLMKEDDKFHLYCFSMGNFLGLNYVRLHPHRVDRMVLHSPWNAECSAMAPLHMIDYTMRIPVIGLMVCDVFRRTSLRHVHDARTYKSIMLTLGEGSKKWKKLLDELAVTDCAPKDVLIICGELEIPFFLLAKDIHKRFQPKSTMHTWKNAGHMTWNEKWNKPVGAFFRNHVYGFLTSSRSTTCEPSSTTCEPSSSSSRYE
mmetsp:Transcript_14470/g.21328  ORF Transcript_14470/g.21328 Transcript_14470/m.21328 type:complete len:381 (+) Transcript_14470:43-1185(+)